MGMQNPNGTPGEDMENVPCQKKLYDPASNEHLKHLEGIAAKDAQGLQRAHRHYGNSWKKRGGVSAFMMIARKWDRLEKYCEEHGYDIFKAMNEDDRSEGIIDDIRDIRRYFMLIEAEARENGIACASAGHRDNLQETAEATERQKGFPLGKALGMLHTEKCREIAGQVQAGAAERLVPGMPPGGNDLVARQPIDRDPGPSGSVSDPQGRSSTGWKGDPARDVD